MIIFFYEIIYFILFLKTFMEKLVETNIKYQEKNIR